MTSQEIARKLAEDRAALNALLEKHKTGETDTGLPKYDFPPGVEDEIYDRRDKLATLQDEYKTTGLAEVEAKNREELALLSRIERRYVGSGSGNASGGRMADMHGKSLGQLVTESWDYKNRKNQPRGKFSVNIEGIDVKTLLTTAGSPGFVPPNDRTNLVVPYANRRPMVADLVPTVNTELQIVKWMEQVTFTNNVSQIAEGGQKPESALDWDEKTVQLRKLAHWIPVTEEQVDDVPSLMNLIENDMSLMLRLQEETQLLYGNGSGENLTGFLTHANLQTQAFSTNNADTVLKAITKVNYTGFANVTGIIMNPANWETIRLLKGATNLDYVLGSPLIDVTPRLWGVPVIITPAITAGTALIGDFVLYSTIWRKNGIKIDVTDSHSDFFIYDKLVIRAEERLALQIKRGAAFCQCTSLT
jgi:HK97 family phage major capsid protein